MAKRKEEKTTDVRNMPMTEQENIVLYNWEKSYGEKDKSAVFVKDGIVNEKLYTDGNHIRILYLLKETNDYDNPDYDLRKFIDRGAPNKDGSDRHPTWDNIFRWTHGIYNLYGAKQAWKEIRELRAGTKSYTLSSICAVNLKKTSGKDTANWKEILDAAIEFGEFINNQIENAQPELIIFCGTTYPYQVINGELDWKQTSRGIDYFIDDNGRIYISYYHPEARVNDNLLYYGLIDAVKEILSEPELKDLRSKYTWTTEF